MLAMMDKTKGRDMLMYTQTEAIKNNLNEYQREKILMKMEMKKKQ